MTTIELALLETVTGGKSVKHLPSNAIPFEPVPGLFVQTRAKGIDLQERTFKLKRNGKFKRGHWESVGEG